ncbi:hypothetical protein ACLJJ6_03460 [Pediococcus siamensis]|uniref:hypothetical protein n=1 Tax=Pediococcus siamensis TaxID=381829 RepID=UPI0039A01C51
MLKKSREGFVLSEALVALSFAVLAITLVVSSMHNREKTVMRINEAARRSRLLLEASRRLDKWETQEIDLGNESVELTPTMFTLRDANHHSLRKMTFE